MGKRRHRNHRDSTVSDQKRLVYTIIIWIIAALASVLIALFIGNSLKNEAEKLKNSEPAFLYTYDGADVAPVEAHFIELAGQTDESLKSTIDALPNNVKAVSLYLREQNSSIAYNSEVYKALFSSSGIIDLKSAIIQLHDKNIYVSACFDCNSFWTEDQNARNASIAFEASLIAEAAIAGVDDIVIMNLPVNDEGISYASKLFSEIRKIKSDACLGAAINYDNVKSDGGAAALEDYSKFADFCAVDASAAQLNGMTSENIADSLLYMFEVYPLRLLIGTSGQADFSSCVNTFNQLGIVNIQAYKRLGSVSLG